MKLTKTVPTKPGFYWASFAPHSDRDWTPDDPSPVRLYEAEYAGFELRVDVIGYDLDAPATDFMWGDEIVCEPVKSCDLPAQPGDDIKLDGGVTMGELFGRVTSGTGPTYEPIKDVDYSAVEARILAYGSVVGPATGYPAEGIEAHKQAEKLITRGWSHDLDDNGALKLTAGRQDWLATVASKARSVKYDQSINKSHDEGELGFWFLQHVVENNFTPQDFDDMYDKLHRSGSNQ